MPAADVLKNRDRLEGVAFDEVYGFSKGRTIIGGARAAVESSLDRDLQALAAAA